MAGFQVAGDDVLAGFAYEPEVEGQVVDGGNLHGQQFLCVEQVAQVGTAVHRVYVRCSVGFDGRVVILPFLVAHVHDTVFGKEHAVSSVTGRHHAIEHVHTAFDAFQNVDRSTYTHQVAGLVLRQNLVDHLNHLVHLLGRLTHG